MEKKGKRKKDRKKNDRRKKKCRMEAQKSCAKAVDGCVVGKRKKKEKLHV